MGLFKPAWMSKNHRTALRAVEKETNQRKLAKIAKNVLSYDIGRVALKKITDQHILADIVLKAKKSIIHDDALKMITDQSILERILYYYTTIKKDSTCAARVISKIKDSTLLESIIQDEKANTLVRASAIETHPHPDQKIITEIVENKALNNLCHRTAAIKRLDDQNFLRQLAFDKEKIDGRETETNVSKDVRMSAIKGLKDEDILMEIFMHTENDNPYGARYFDDSMRKAALEKISDQSKLTEIALKTGAENAIARLNDIDVLNKISKKYNTDRNARGIRPNASDHAKSRLGALAKGKK